MAVHLFLHIFRGKKGGTFRKRWLQFVWAQLKRERKQVALPHNAIVISMTLWICSNFLLQYMRSFSFSNQNLLIFASSCSLGFTFWALLQKYNFKSFQTISIGIKSGDWVGVGKFLKSLRIRKRRVEWLTCFPSLSIKIWWA